MRTHAELLAQQDKEAADRVAHETPEESHAKLEAFLAGPPEPKVIKDTADLPEFTEEFLALIKDLGEASIGFIEPYGNIDWDRFYEMFESNGYDMQDFGGSADNKIRRTVRKIVEY
jgi:hypothetical protein